MQQFTIQENTDVQMLGSDFPQPDFKIDAEQATIDDLVASNQKTYALAADRFQLGVPVALLSLRGEKRGLWHA